MKKIYIIVTLFMLFSLNLFAITDNYLRKTSLDNNQLRLQFKYEIDKVKHFQIKGANVVKHIYDIKDVALPSTKDISQFKFKGIKAFRIAQYSKKVVRVVIEARTSIKGSYKIKGKALIISLPSNLKSKSVQTAKYRYKSARRYKTVILDAGHGGRDIGASSKSIREKDLTLSMTLKLRDILTKMGYRVLLTRSRDRFMNLKQRTDYAYNKRDSIFVSIHANAAPRRKTKGVRYEGVEVFYLGLENTSRVRNGRVTYRGRKVYSQADYREMISAWKFSTSKKLAYSVHDAILGHVSRRYTIYDKGIKRQDFWVLLATKMPSILIETGYLTNKNEVKKLKNSHYQTRLMEGVAKGINRYYGLY